MDRLGVDVVFLSNTQHAGKISPTLYNLFVSLSLPSVELFGIYFTFQKAAPTGKPF
jgi:hypothetical protein